MKPLGGSLSVSSAKPMSGAQSASSDGRMSTLEMKDLEDIDPELLKPIPDNGLCHCRS